MTRPSPTEAFTPPDAATALEGRLLGEHRVVVAHAWGWRREGSADVAGIPVELLALEGIGLTLAAHLLLLSGRGPAQLLGSVVPRWVYTREGPATRPWTLLAADTPQVHSPPDYLRVVLGRPPEGHLVGIDAHDATLAALAFLRGIP